jgi:hypothetical protein
LADDVSADVSSALELATAAGSADGVLPAASATSADFLLSEDFDAAFSDLPCADRFPSREPCLIDFPAVALSDFAAVSAPAAVACGWPPNHTKIPVANIKAKRPLAVIIIWLSPR